MKIFSMLVLLSIIFSLKCSSNEDSNERLSLLLKENAKVNYLISEKNWDLIYYKLLETKKMHLTKRNFPSRKSFNRQYNQGGPATYKLKYLTFRSFNDTAITSNQIHIKIKIDYLGIDTSAIDTSYHYWKFYDKNWYLLDFEKREISEINLERFNDSIYMLKAH